MSKLHPNGKDRYAFDDLVTLKTLLSIDGKCFATTTNGERCKNKPARTPIDIALRKANNSGFPSPGAASGLQEAYRKCMCWRHSLVVTGHGPGAEACSQEDRMYPEWNRRLWVEFLLANKVSYVYENKPPPDLSDEGEWREQLGRLAAALPHVKRDDNPPSSLDPPAEAGLKAIRPGSPAPEPLKRRPSTLQKLFVSRGRSIGRIMSAFSRSAAAHTEVRGFAESSRREHPAHREQRKKSDEKPGVHGAIGGFAETDHREDPVHSEPENEDDEKPGVADAPPRVEVKLATPEKCQGSTTGANNSIQRLLGDGVDASPGESILSIAPSATFSMGESNLNGTPETLYSHYDPMSTTGKVTSSCEGRTDQNDAIDVSPAPAAHVQETPAPSPDPPDVFSLPSESTAPHPDSNWLRRPKDMPPTGGTSALESRPSSGQRLRENASHQLDTPSKSRPSPAIAAPSFPDDSERLSYEDGQPGATRGDADFEPFRKKQGVTRKGRDTLQYQTLKHILVVLEKRMHKRQRNGGYVYIFRRNDAPNFLKIGRSVEAFGERPRKIGLKCGYEVEFLDDWHMDMAVSAIETCVHSHLDKSRHWDMRCDRIFKEKNLEGKTSRCKEKHKEWFKVKVDRAREVVVLWHDFISTRPFVNGTLNSFWRNEVDLVWNKMEAWKKNHYHALERWEDVMRIALDRWNTTSAGDPMADLPLRLSVRSEGAGSVLEIRGEEGLSDVPLLSIPMLSRQRKKPETLHRQAAPPIDT